MLSSQAYVDCRVRRGAKEILVLLAHVVYQEWEERKERWVLQVRLLHYLKIFKILLFKLILLKTPEEVSIGQYFVKIQAALSMACSMREQDTGTWSEGTSFLIKLQQSYQTRAGGRGHENC